MRKKRNRDAAARKKRRFAFRFTLAAFIFVKVVFLIDRSALDVK